MRRTMAIVALIVSSLAGGSAAQAVVLHDSVSGVTAGAALVAGTRPGLPANWSVQASGAPCADPASTPDFSLGARALCWRGGRVLHAIETFAIRWDRPSPDRAYWSTTLGYLHTFLGDVAAGSGTLTSPFAITGQYHDAAGGAGTSWLYGGGCSDLGSVGSTCTFPHAVANGPGTDYPVTPSCPIGQPCTISDADVRGEVSAMVQNMNLTSRAQPGFSPLVTVLTPPNVVVCLDPAHTLCSANQGPSGARMCSYHATVSVGGEQISYVVQPWTIYTGCDELEIPSLPSPPPVVQVETDAGQRLVSPLSQGMIDAAVNPGVTDGWVAGDGSEISDNGCAPASIKVDTVTVGSNPYWLQREFNDAATMEPEPWTFGCAPGVDFQPAFVAPSPVNHGDAVAFDGTDTISTLLVPRANYGWDFGDGTGASGPSVVHSYAKGGTYDVTLTVVDRGGHKLTVTHPVSVLPIPLGGGPLGGGTAATVIHARLQLLPQSLRSVLRSGVAVRVSSNLRADGFTQLTISRGAARQAHLRTGRSATVMIGRGTIAGIAKGTRVIHVRIPAATVRKLAHLRHLTLTLRLTLVGSGRAHQTIDAAGRY